MAMHFLGRGNPPPERRRRFSSLLIVEDAALLVIAYLAVTGITHFRVEAVAAVAGVATLGLTFIRHVTDARRARQRGSRQRWDADEMPRRAFDPADDGNDCGRTEGCRIVVVVVVLTSGGTR